MTGAISRATAILKIKANELGLVALVTGLMFFANTGAAVGSTGIETLFYSRFGVEFLPFMYIILGLITPLTSLGMTSLLARVSQLRLHVILPLVMSLYLAGARFILGLDLTWFYAALWLSMSIFWLLQSLYSWGLAGIACDTRQAKRLFPLFAVGAILGLATGSFLTRLLVNAIGTENLILVWAAGLMVAFVLAQRLAANVQVDYDDQPARRQAPALLDVVKEGFGLVRSLPLLRWISLAAVLFAVLYYALAFPFAKAVTAEFPDEAAMATFLGTFYGLATAVAVLASLLFANRLYARFGFMTAIMVYPVIYLFGFAIVAFTNSFAAIVLFRFVQTFWSEGVSEGANQAMFNVIPPGRREQSRTFVRGIANQLGVSIAGVLLVFSERNLSLEYLFVIGMAAAALTIYFVWQARRAYGPALVAALRAGQSSIFFGEEQPFGGFRQDATAVSTALAGINSQEVAVRRVAAEILGNLSLPEATNAIVGALDDPDASVRVALLRAIGSAQATSTLLEVAALLKDPAPEVRLQAIKTLSQLTPYARGLQAHLESLLYDQDATVRCYAAAGMLKLGPNPAAEALLREMATSAGQSGDEIGNRILALEALAEWGSQEAYDIAAAGIGDQSPAIRRVSATIMAKINAEQCLIPLVQALGDEDKLVREAIARALGHVGVPAVELALAALRDPRKEEGALIALQYLPTQRAEPAIQAYAQDRVTEALHYHGLWLSCQGFIFTKQQTSPNGNPVAREEQLDRERLLADSLRGEAHYHGTNALKAMAVLGNRRAIHLAIDNLTSPHANQRANAMEALDSIGQPDIVRPLLPLWEASEPGHVPADNAWLLTSLQDPNPWIRACSALVAGQIAEGSIAAQLTCLVESDPDPFVRESAQPVVDGETNMDALPTLPIMERILFLRRVPIFANLPPNDLKQIAAVAGEQTFGDGTIIARQGESGNVMYIILSGEVLVTALDEEGTGKELGRRQPGEYVGEMAVISDEVRMATLVAAGDVRTLCITQRQFQEILRTRPEVSLAVMAVLCARLRERG